MPRTMCFRSASGCSADRSICRSRMAVTRGQSVLEIFEEDRFFISRRLPKRDHVNLRRRLSVHYGNSHSSEQTKRDKARFVVREAIVLESESWPFEHSGRIDEVQPVLLQVATTLPFVPGKFRPRKTALRSVYTACLCVKAHARRGHCDRRTAPTAVDETPLMRKRRRGRLTGSLLWRC